MSQTIHEQLFTIRDYLRWALSCFNGADLYYGHGTDNAWDDACALVLSTLHLDPNSGENILDARLTLDERELLASRIHERTHTRKPVPYLTNEAWFMGLPFYVDERVLIPRSPFAELISESFAPWVDTNGPLRILDLCTGSACMAIACALQFPDAKVDAVDISPDALAVAKINVDKHRVADQVTLVESDLFQQLPEQRYHIIISNPPYVTNEQIDALPAEYGHEPRLALYSKGRGLHITERILANAHDYLMPNGQLFIEVGLQQDEMMARHGEAPLIWLDFAAGGEGVFTLNGADLAYFTQERDII